MGENKANRWSWLPEFMPGVARLLAERRKVLGDAFVNECWRHGVVLREPDWFFAIEGAIALGTPFTDPALQAMASWNFSATQATVMLARPEVQRAA